MCIIVYNLSGQIHTANPFRHPPPTPHYMFKTISLYVCVDECLVNMIVCLIKYFILTYTASCYNRIFAENAPKILTKIHQNMTVRLLPNRAENTLTLYSFHGSLVERPDPNRGGACSIPGKNIIFKLGLSPSQDHKAGG